MESALFAHRPSMCLSVKANRLFAFTLITLSDKHLHPKGEEVKAKIEKHRTRGRARFGRKAMVLRLKGAQRRKKDRSISIAIDTMHRDVYAFAYTASLQSSCINDVFSMNCERNVENTPRRL